MALDAKHPQYTSMLPEWTITSDVYGGEARVKAKRTEYLPATDGMLLDGMANAQQLGWKKYDGYLKRAVFPSYFEDAISTAVGLMHRKQADIKLPKALEAMRNNATVDGESLDLLLRKMNEAQLKDGRLGLLLDVPSGLGPADAMPFIALYNAARIINWDAGRREQGRTKLEIVVLDESEYVRSEDFNWKMATKYRALMLSSEIATVTGENQAAVADGTYITGVTADNQNTLASVTFTAPSIAGRTLDEIPFVFVNASDVAPDVARPPLIGLANHVLAIYRGEADYRQCLFMQAQETLVIIGGNEEEEEGDSDTVRAGSGAKIEVPVGGDAKYIGISADGLGEMRQSLENDRDLAQQQGSKMLSTKGGDQQSGDALRTRVAAQTASLPIIAKTSAEALERILKFAARLKGANEDEVSVKPNLDFTADVMSGQNLMQLMQSKQMGAPLSLESIHDTLREQGMTTRTFEEEMEMIQGEKPLMPPAPVRGVGGNPNLPPNDPSKPKPKAGA